MLLNKNLDSQMTS